MVEKRSARTFARALLVSALSLTAYATMANAAEEWGYSGSTGPENWHTLSPANSLCKDGKQQTPINIEGTEPAIMYALNTDYAVTPIDLSNANHTIKQAYESGSFLRIGQKKFELKQFHFHTPSEHTIDGERFPMTIHFVHQAADGSLAVIGVMVKEGNANIAAQELFDNIPLEHGQVVKNPKTLINARDLMPNDKSYFRYMGSLTTPPCSEGVNWYVLKHPIEFSKEQINMMSTLMGGENARPLQNRNNRVILDARPQ